MCSVSCLHVVRRADGRASVRGARSVRLVQPSLVRGTKANRGESESGGAEPEASESRAKIRTPAKRHRRRADKAKSRSHHESLMMLARSSEHDSIGEFYPLPSSRLASHQRSLALADTLCLGGQSVVCPSLQPMLLMDNE